MPRLAGRLTQWSLQGGENGDWVPCTSRAFEHRPPCTPTTPHHTARSCLQTPPQVTLPRHARAQAISGTCPRRHSAAGAVYQQRPHDLPLTTHVPGGQRWRWHSWMSLDLGARLKSFQKHLSRMQKASPTRTQLLPLGEPAALPPGLFARGLQGGDV